MFWKKEKPGRNPTHTERALQVGENGYQEASFQARETNDPLALHRFIAVAERPCRYADLAGLDSGVDTLARVVESLRPNQKGDPRVCVIVQNGNPIGIGLDAHSGEKAVQRARDSYPAANRQSVVLSNCPITDGMAVCMAAMLPTVVAAPQIDEPAQRRLLELESVLAYTNGALRWPNVDRAMMQRPVRGGQLRQEPAAFTLPDLLELEWTKEETDGVTEDDLCIAFAAAWSSRHGGHEVALAHQGRLLGCAGGPTLQSALRTTIERAREHHDLRGSVFVASTPINDNAAVELLLGVECRAGLMHEGDDEGTLAALEALKSARVNVGLLPSTDTGVCGL